MNTHPPYELKWPLKADPQFRAEDTTSRQFSTGATRDTDVNKLDYEGFLSPLVLEAYAMYMNVNRMMPEGQVRNSDNWQLGIPLDAYMKSKYRHFMGTWKEHRGFPTEDGQIINLLGELFNTMGYLHELIKKDPVSLHEAIREFEEKRKSSFGHD